MSSIDRRIVEARFDNKDFKKGVSDTLKSVSDLEKGLKLDGAKKGLSDIDAASGRITFGAMSSGIAGLIGQFGTLKLIAVGAIAAIGYQVAQTAAGITKNFTLKPARDGLAEYETNLNSIQTILSNTKWEDKTLNDVNAALQELNEYSDLTIYNFAEMARNIGTFTAAGVGLDTAVGAIKGIANLAAVSGSNSQQASTAMYQLSQALSTGTVKLMDWNSVVNAGMGGKVFQDAIKETARAHGIAIDEIIENSGSFRDSLQEGWFSSDILTDTLATFTGDLSKEQLRQMGYAEDAIEGILEMGQTATDAATKVKTFTQLMDTLQETAASGWSQTFQLILGDFDQAKELFTSINDSVSGWIDKTSDWRNDMLRVWQDLGGRDLLIEGITSAFQAFGTVLKPISEALKGFLPGIDGQKLYDLTKTFAEFAEGLKIGEETAAKVKSTFEGLFAIFGIGWEILKEVGGLIATVFDRMSDSLPSILDTTATAGEKIKAFYDAIKEGEGLGIFFDKLADSITWVTTAVGDMVSALFNLVGLGDLGMDDLYSAAETMRRIADSMDGFFKGFANTAIVIRDALSNAFENIVEFILKIPGKLADYFSQVDWGLVLSAINTGLFGAFLVMFNNFVNGLSGKNSIATDFKTFVEAFAAPLGELGTAIGSLGGVFDEVTETLSVMQGTLKAFTLLQIAAALALMTSSIIDLSRVPVEDLTRGLTVMAALFIELMAANKAFILLGGFKGLIRGATGLILLSAAIVILTHALTELAELDWEELMIGLTGVGALLLQLVITTKLMTSDVAGMIRAGAGLILIAAAIKILASAVGDFADLDWEEMKKGLIGVGTLLAGLAIFTRLASTNGAGIGQGAGLILLATAVLILAEATEKFGDMDWGSIGKGVAGVGAMLAMFAAFSQLVDPAGILRTGIALTIASAGLYVLVEVVQKFSEMNWEELSRGMVGLASVLAIVGVALSAMPASSMFGAAALVVASGAILVISKAFKSMGSMSWDEIGKGLIVLGGALTILAVGLNAIGANGILGAAALLAAAGALSLLVPVLYLLGGIEWSTIGKGLAVLAGVMGIIAAAGYLLAPTVPVFMGIAAAFALMGLGVALIGGGLFLISEGLASLGDSTTTLIKTLKELVELFIEVLPSISTALATGLIRFVEEIGKGVDQISETITTLLLALIEDLTTLIPAAVTFIITLVEGILEAIVALAPKLYETVLILLTEFLEASEDYMPRIVDAGTDLIIAFLEGIVDKLPAMITAAKDILVAWLKGVKDNLRDIQDAGADLIIEFIEGIANNALKIIEAAADTLIVFMFGLSKAIRDNTEEMRAAGASIGLAIIDGFTFGLGSKAASVARKAAEVARGALEAAKNALGMASPSKEFMSVGRYSAEGMAIGLASSSFLVSKEAKNMGENALSTIRKTISDISSLIDLDADMRPTITPIIDMREINKSVNDISDTFGQSNFTVSGSYANAKNTSQALAKVDAIKAEQVIDGVGNLVYNQYNSSPKALSTAEVYRQTRNQLSVTKGALATNATQDS